MHAVLLLLWLCQAPAFDPWEGEQWEAGARQLLPASHTAANAADRLFTATVGLQPVAGPLSQFDADLFAVYGGAWGQLRPSWMGQDLSDPGRPGEALLAIPEAAWDRLVLRALWSDRPGLHIWTAPPQAGSAPLQARLAGRGGTPLGGAIWLPNGAFDRADARLFGAPEDRRSLRQLTDVSGSLASLGRWGRLVVHGELLQRLQHYPTLVPEEGGERASLLAVGRRPGAAGDSFAAAWQASRRSHAGAPFRFDLPLTAAQRSQAAVLLWQRPRRPGGLQLGASLGWRRQRSRPNASAAQRTDLLDSWLLLRRPTFFDDSDAGRLAAQASWRGAHGLCGQADAALAGWQRDWRIVAARSEQTLDGLAWRRTEWDPAPRVRVWQPEARASLHWRGSRGPLAARLFAGAALSGQHFAPLPQASLVQLAPTGGLSGRWRLGTWGGELFALARQEPWRLDATVGDFLARGGPSGTTFAAAADAGAALERTGNAWHDRAAQLAPPSTTLWSLGYSSTPLWPLRLRLQGTGRHLWRRYTVVAQPPPSLVAAPLRDPGGDGRGETAAPGGGQDLTVYAEAPAQRRERRFALANDAAPAHYLGVELALDAALGRVFSAHLAGVAYLSAGAAPLGNGVDRNDPGALSEASAGPLAALHRRGRYGADRAYLLKLLLSARPTQRLSLGFTLRFRDGEPFTRLLLARSLPQGAELLMAVDRGEPRYTFDATADLRLRYLLGRAPVRGLLSLDVHNLLGAGTEILEDPRTGPSFRRALERLPGRMLLVQLELLLDAPGGSGV